MKSLWIAVAAVLCSIANSLPTPKQPNSNNNNNIPLDIEELARLGMNTEELLALLKQIAEGNYLCGAKDIPDMRRHYLRNNSVTCNDGSRAGYYIRKSHGSSRWLVFLEGGWFCFDQASCEGRWINTPQLMSSTHWPDKRKGTGILSWDPEENPYLFNANIVYVPYCSSDSWTGTSKRQKRGEFSFSYMGALIVEEVVKDLLEDHGLATAKRLILGGSSAGGTGVLLNLDHIAGLMAVRAPRVDVRGIADSGWFLDNAQYKRVECTDAHSCAPTTGIQRGIQLWEGRVPESCREVYKGGDSWRCYFGYRMYPTLKTPVFVVQHLFDEAQITADNVGPPIKKEQWQYIHNMGKDMKRTLMNVSAVFAPACLSHTLLTKPEWQKVAIADVTLPQALKCWEEGTQETNHYHTSKHHKERSYVQQLITGEYRSRRMRPDKYQSDDPELDAARQKRRRRRKNRKRKNRERERKRRGKKKRKKVLRKPTLPTVDIYLVTNNTNHPTHTSGPFSDVRANRRRYRERRDLARSLIRPRRSILYFDDHDIHHMKYHDNQCNHHRLDHCAWPQCNLSCPKIHNPFTGEEMDFIDLLLQFGLDLSSIANALGMDLPTLQTMDHDVLLQLLTQQR